LAAVCGQSCGGSWRALAASSQAATCGPHAGGQTPKAACPPVLRPIVHRRRLFLDPKHGQLRCHMFGLEKKTGECKCGGT
jgi:hypothetical protein